MGPEGGKGGGEVLFSGAPEQLAKNGKGYTWLFLKQEL
jgi:excinuclease ABC subunit A